MSEENEYFNVLEKTRYCMTIMKTESMADLEDSFISSDELRDLVGPTNYYMGGSPGPKMFFFHDVIEADLVKYTQRLEASGKRSIRIDDPDLVEALKDSRAKHLKEYTDENYCRHGSRIRYWSSRKRIKKAVTAGDVAQMWGIFSSAFQGKYGTYMPWPNSYNRTVALFNVFKKFTGWRACRKHMPDNLVKWYRLIWDNPEEYL